MQKQYETVIGLEVHVELDTDTKIFCGCTTRFGGRPNTQTCPVCSGLPGTLPVLNKKVVEYALKAGLALNCQINKYSLFDRKNYLYPDNPQNYQISQLYLPLCYDGWMEIKTAAGSKRIGIREIHMEEDAGKLIHDEWRDCSLVDYNRSGVPLIEIVSEPDLRNAEEVIAYLDQLRVTMQYLGVSDCKLQEGSMRVDVNLSVRQIGATELGTRTEMKNLNSFKAIARAIAGEAERQGELLQAEKVVRQETRRWDDNKEFSYPLRTKEDAEDYRYFPDPDLVPIKISDQWIREVKENLPELRAKKLVRYQQEYHLSEYDAEIITESKKMADIFEATTQSCQQPKKAANWLIGETLKYLREKKLTPEDLTFSPHNLGALILLIEAGKINQNIGKKVFRRVMEVDVDPRNYVLDHGLETVGDTDRLEKVIQEVLGKNERAVREYQRGKVKVMGFLIGQVMKKMNGRVDPSQVEELLKSETGRFPQKSLKKRKQE